MDVFPQEPMSNKDTFLSELRGLPNTILTPQAGGSTLEAQKYSQFRAYSDNRLYQHRFYLKYCWVSRYYTPHVKASA